MIRVSVLLSKKGWLYETRFVSYSKNVEGLWCESDLRPKILTMIFRLAAKQSRTIQSLSPPTYFPAIFTGIESCQCYPLLLLPLKNFNCIFFEFGSYSFLLKSHVLGFAFCEGLYYYTDIFADERLWTALWREMVSFRRGCKNCFYHPSVPFSRESHHR